MLSFHVKFMKTDRRTDGRTVKQYDPPIFRYGGIKMASTNLKGLADNKSYVAEMMIYVFVRIVNIVGKGENAGYQHFLFSHNVFKRLFLRDKKS